MVDSVRSSFNKLPLTFTIKARDSPRNDARFINAGYSFTDNMADLLVLSANQQGSSSTLNPTVPVLNKQLTVNKGESSRDNNGQSIKN